MANMLGGKPRQKIRTPRRIGQIGAEEPNFDVVWGTLAASFQQIHQKQASSLSYEELYRAAYQLVLKKKGERLYESVDQFERNYLTVHIQNQVKSLISDSLTRLHLAPSATYGSSVSERHSAGERFLKGLRNEWTDHCICLNMISDVTMYLDRVYCTDTGRASLYTRGVQLFRDCVLKSQSGPSDAVDPKLNTVLSVIVNTMLDQIQMERDGDIIDKSMLKGCTQVLEGMYVGKAEIDEEKLYHKCFEPRFLEESRKFYKQESERMLQDTDAGSYCRQTKKRLVEEQDRCRSSLSESTRPKIDQIVADELISHKIKELIEMESGVVYMFNNDRLDELQLIYELSGKVDPEKKELKDALQEKIFHSGNEINRAALTPPIAEGTIANQQTAAAIRWVEDVLALKDKYDRIVDRAFSSDQKLHAAQTQSFAKFVNYASFGRAAENVSLFIDDNMKKGIKDKSEAEIETVLQKAIDLLKYISDKDMFERYYNKHLSRRLLMNKSQNMDVEKQMIGKMKVELGNTFTTKMEVMFKDMSVSEDLTSQFKAHRSTIRSDEEDTKKRPVDLGIQVLTSMTWPHFLTNALSGGQQARPKILYPEDVERAMTSFDRFYSKKHNGRRLTWLPSLGTADVKATFPGTSKSLAHTHEINVPTYSMVVLHLFNDLPAGESLSCKEIQATTNIPMLELIRNLQSLAVAPKTRILRKEPMSKDVKEDDRFYFNDKFNSAFRRIKVGLVASNNRVESERERLDTEKKNDETRIHVCEAAIVRIMKQRKELTHQMLVSETISQLTQFKPEVSMIKARIENLIEREYLERIGDGSTYRYLA